MRFFIVLIVLGISAPPGAVDASSLAVKPGRATLAIAPLSGSVLPLDLTLYDHLLCPGGTSKGRPPRGQCGATVENGTERTDPIEVILGVSQLIGGKTLVPLEVIALDLLGPEPWITPCGSFDFSVALDPWKEQPVSRLTLAPDGEAPYGVFSALLEAAIILRFDALGGGRVEVPARIRIPMGGPYALVDPEMSKDKGLSNLVLLARREDEEWEPALSCTSPPKRCPDFCLTASKKTVDELHLSSPVAVQRADGSQ